MCRISEAMQHRMTELQSALSQQEPALGLSFFSMAHGNCVATCSACVVTQSNAKSNGVTAVDIQC
jgi:hypothetical protein